MKEISAFQKLQKNHILKKNNFNDNDHKHHKPKLRFLFLSSDTHPPFRVDVKVLFGQVLADRNHAIDWILQSSSPCKKAYQIKLANGQIWVGANCLGSSVGSKLKKHFLNILNDLRIFKILKLKKYDFIQVKDKYISALPAVFASRMYRTKFIYWLSFPSAEASLLLAKSGFVRYRWFYFIRGKLFAWILYRLIMPASFHIFVQSQQMKLDVMDKGIPAKKITPIPMGISLQMFQDIEVDNSKPGYSKHKKLVYLGTLNRNRRLEFLVRTFKQVHCKKPNTKLFFIGDSDRLEDREQLYQECIRLGVHEAVLFTGFLPRESAFKYVKQADVCLSPFFPTPILNSTSPTKLIEYMALGKPVVANDHPEQRLVIEESGGGLCVPYDENAFAEGILYLLNNPEKAKEMGRLGQHYVEANRSYDKIADIVEETYLQIFDKWN